MRVRSACLFFSALVLAASACSRTGLWELLPESEGRGGSSRGGSTSKSEPECSVDSDCPVLDPCAPPVCVVSSSGRTARCEARALDCDDGNVCTVDRCNPELGSCEYVAPQDLDRDGYVGVAPAGAPADCGGADCDDDDPTIHPGATDACNGKDDDCDGAIDDGLTYRVGTNPVELAPEAQRSQHGGISWSGGEYGVTYSTLEVNRRSYFGLLEFDGDRRTQPVPISEINADSYAGAVAWSGESFLTAWADARQDGNYEIYATRFDSTARELSADERLTNAANRSLRPSVRFNGGEFVVVWDDHRFEVPEGERAVFGLRLSARGVVLGGEIRLSGEDEYAEYAALALAEERIGVAYVVSDGSGDGSVRFRSFDRTLLDGRAPVELGADGQEPSVARVSDDRFLVAWHTGSQARNFGPAIEAALIDAYGGLIARSTVTSGDVFAKWSTLVSLGDRAVLIWSGAGPDGAYALHYEVLSAADLTPIGSRQLAARSSGGGSLVDPVATLGELGDIAVLYDDNQSGVYRSYFIRLTCQQELR